MITGDLGRGVHGKVKLARDTITGQSCAIKIVDKSVRRRYRMSQYGGGMPSSREPHLDKIRREIAILKKCRHPNVVRLNEVIDDPDARKIYLILELLDGGEVRWKQPDADLPLLSQEDTRRIFRDVVLGLEYLHHQGIVHRDIKPANLLMTADSRTVKITDFGVSHLRAPRTASLRNSSTSSLAKTVGSPAFFAPELCYTGDVHRLSSGNRSNSSSRPPVTKAIDVWALGVTLYCLVYGRCPFMAETEWELFNVIPRKELTFPSDVVVSPLLRDLLQRLLTKDPTARITLSEVKRHPWVVADLPDPDGWRRATDPTRYTQVNVTDEEVKRAVTIKERIRNQIRRLSNTLGLRKRSKPAQPSANTVAAMFADDTTSSSSVSGH
ncbi:kinase-like domain-containing protein [Thamnocephalis sphaerospora]|uniref:Kinase-like domain-containing protein n=1 Tax=Thamnocephalis sphaerospora TaxID=78915 RepID=A0A4P9XNX3_9FUNG|nr:kinase-like domain-containing protein [Thamnocephalis sphaerospora]|eukprot:RKP07693.1 kinase-like domain-containing protein [Thamnocephalis sphaerospora]